MREQTAIYNLEHGPKLLRRRKSGSVDTATLRPVQEQSTAAPSWVSILTPTQIKRKSPPMDNTRRGLYGKFRIQRTEWTRCARREARRLRILCA